MAKPGKREREKAKLAGKAKEALRAQRHQLAPKPVKVRSMFPMAIPSGYRSKSRWDYRLSF